MQHAVGKCLWVLLMLALVIGGSATAAMGVSYPAPTLTSPANNAVNVPQPVQMQWMAVGASQYQIQLAINSQFVSVMLDLTSTVIPSVYASQALAPGVRYYWRVRGKDFNGTGAWSQPWSFIAKSANLPRLASPLYGSINLTSKPRLSWYPIPGASSYNVEVSYRPDYANLVGINSTGYTATVSYITLPTYTLELSTTYYWRVRANNSAGSTGWSPSWCFTTGPSGMGPAFQVPQLTAPPNGAIGLTSRPRFQWVTTPYANYYQLELTDVAANSSTVWTMHIPFVQANVGSPIVVDFRYQEFYQYYYNSTQSYNTNSWVVPYQGYVPWYGLPLPLSLGKTYTWRVNAGTWPNQGQWSPSWTFKVVADSAVILYTPHSGAQNVMATPYFAWSTMPECVGYRLQISTDPTFQAAATITVTTTQTTYQVPLAAPLQLSTTYYWRVQGYNARVSTDGSTSEVSDTPWQDSKSLGVFTTF